MNEFLRKRRLGWLAVLPCLIFPPAPAAPARGAATSWTVKIILEAAGDYRLEAPGVKAAGTYALSFRWTGTMARDDEDYLLVHDSCDLTKWEIEETAGEEGTHRILTTDDIADKPALKVNYILKLEDGLHVDFAVEGFPVPRAISSDAFELLLPASAGNIARFGGLDYDLFVKTGSNKIILDEKAVQRGPAEKTFDWTWKHQAWIQKPQRTVFQASGHRAKAKIEITPR